MHAVTGRWHEIVGPTVAEHTTVETFDDGVLTHDHLGHALADATIGVRFKAAKLGQFGRGGVADGGGTPGAVVEPGAVPARRLAGGVVVLAGVVGRGPRGERRLDLLGDGLGVQLLGPPLGLGAPGPRRVPGGPPLRVGRARLAGLRGLGINRLSLGAQSLQPDELRLLGRLHDVGDVERAFEAARGAGFENVSLDFMFGLPGQSPAAWEATLDGALALAPEHPLVDALTDDAHRDEVAAYRAGKTKLMGFFVGQVMKATRGQANPRLVNEILKRMLAA